MTVAPGTADGRRDPACPRLGPMGVREDCRHYSTRTVGADEIVQRCRVDANQRAPFACPEGCLFFEPRSISETGWKLDPNPDEDW